MRHPEPARKLAPLDVLTQEEASHFDDFCGGYQRMPGAERPSLNPVDDPNH
jgi:hypothetical protein